MRVLLSVRPNTKHQYSKSDQDTAQGEVGIQPSKIGYNLTIHTLKLHNGKVPSHRTMRCLSIWRPVYHHQLTMCPYYSKQLDTLPHVILTLDTDWGPIVLGSMEAEYYERFDTVSYPLKLESRGHFYVHGDYVDWAIFQDNKL